MVSYKILVIFNTLLILVKRLVKSTKLKKMSLTGKPCGIGFKKFLVSMCSWKERKKGSEQLTLKIDEILKQAVGSNPSISTRVNLKDCGVSTSTLNG